MSAKLERREVIESGSPLQHHSLNQEQLKRGRDGRKRWGRQVAIFQSEPTDDQITLSADLLQELPFSQAFKDGIWSSMVDLARERIKQEEASEPTIPQRLVNILTDVGRVYRQAKKRGIHLEMVEKPDLSSADIWLPTRGGKLRYPDLFPRQVFLAQFRQNPSWRFMSEQQKDFLVLRVPEVLLINLTACDFTLQDEVDLLTERVITYGYLLATLGIASHLLLPKTREKAIDNVYKGYLDSLIKYFRK